MKINILFAGYDFRFMQEIIQLFQQHPAFEVKRDQWLTHSRHDENSSRKLLEWADIIIANWCLGNAVWYAKNKKPEQKLFIRFHRFEITTSFPKRLRIENVDKVLYSSPIFQQEFEEITGLPEEKSLIVYSPVNEEKFTPVKEKGAEFNLGMLGCHRVLKRPDRAFDILERLKEKDSRYKLFLKGYSPQEVKWIWNKQQEQEYFTNLYQRIDKSPHKDSVIFQKFSTDVHEWFQNVGFILSLSDVESFHSAVAEGMISGSIPMIMGWQGSELIYPGRFIKKDTNEIVDAIIAYSNNQKLLIEERSAVREYCLRHFSLKKIFEIYLDLVSQSLGVISIK